MDIGTYWHLFFECNSLASFVAEKETGKLVYYNKPMEKLFREGVDILGCPFYQVIEADTVAFSDWSTINWNKTDVVQDKIFIQRLNQVFSVDFVSTEYQGNSYLYGRFSPVQTTKHFNYSFEEMMSHSISISQGEESEKIPRLLEILGQFYHAEKTFLYYIDRNEMSISALHIWTKFAGEGTQTVFLTTMECKKLLSWVEDRDEQGIIQATKNHLSFCELSLESELLAALDIKTLY